MRWRLHWLVLLAAGALACGQAALPEADANGREAAAGRKIFERKCASCHSRRGDGKTIVAGRFRYANLIDGVWRGNGSGESIERQIRKGKDPMPKFEGKLTDEEIRQTVAYVLELSGSAERRANR